MSHLFLDMNLVDASVLSFLTKSFAENISVEGLYADKRSFGRWFKY